MHVLGFILTLRLGGRVDGCVCHPQPGHYCKTNSQERKSQVDLQREVGYIYMNYRHVPHLSHCIHTPRDLRRDFGNATKIRKDIFVVFSLVGEDTLKSSHADL